MTGIPDELARATLTRARSVALALVAGVLVLLIASSWVELPARTDALIFPAAIVGLISPAIGYRLYQRIRDRSPDEAESQRRCDGFVRANIVALGVTEGAALLGIVAYALSRALPALFGVLAHLLLTGAIWPTPERLEAFLAAASAPHADAGR